jgi:DNA modification methylase
MSNINKEFLKENELTKTIYSLSVTTQLRESISEIGILEPLIVQKELDGLYTIISGIRRYRIGLELGYKFFPCEVIERTNIDEILIIHHNNQRIKKPSELLKELIFINKEYGLKQGVIIEKGSKKEQGMELKKGLKKTHGKTKVDRLINLHKKTKEYSQGNQEMYDEIMTKLDKDNKIQPTINYVESLLIKRKMENNPPYKTCREINIGDVQIFNKDSSSLSELKDESVSCIVTSIPYYHQRDYDLGSNQYGMENSLEMYAQNITSHFDECKRVLKPTGSLWVNVGDKIQNGELLLVGSEFAREMKRNGWILNQKITWIKNNPRYTEGPRCVLNEEHIFHFVKQKDFYYSVDWLSNDELIPEEFRIGNNGNRKFKSTWDYNQTVLRTNLPNNVQLENLCKKLGVPYTHSATFPGELPLMSILSTSKKGDIVLDPFNGTGTTGSICLLTDRKYVGYELNQSYMNVSEIRIQDKYESVTKIAA